MAVTGGETGGKMICLYSAVLTLCPAALPSGSDKFFSAAHFFFFASAGAMTHFFAREV
jgi:hypothetical protein